MVLVLFPLSAGFPLLVAASDLSAPKKCRARFGLDQQNNWCGPCRCVWCVLAQARARWRLANCTLRLPPLLSAAAFSFLFPSLLSVPPGYRDLSASSSHVLPVYLCEFFIYLFFYLFLGKKGFNSVCQSVCMNGVCVFNIWKELQGFYCRISEILNWQVWAWRIWCLMAWS